MGSPVYTDEFEGALTSIIALLQALVERVRRLLRPLTLRAAGWRPRLIIWPSSS